MGHNFGMSHDFNGKNEGRGCTGIMDYGEAEDVWSQCARDDFRSHYELYVASKGKHCMKGNRNLTASFVWVRKARIKQERTSR